MAAFYMGRARTAQDEAVVEKLVSYIGIECRDPKLGNADSVARLFQFGCEEDPEVARKRLQDFVTEDLAKLESAARCERSLEPQSHS